MLETFGYTGRHDDGAREFVAVRQRGLFALPSIESPKLCHGCLRSLARHREARDSVVPYCDSCTRALERDPNVRLHEMRNGRSERLPQEGPLGDTSWQKHANCYGAPPELFDTRSLGNGVIDETIQATAEIFCGPCPVRAECGAAADARHFLGLFGGAWRSARSSDPAHYEVRDLLPDDTIDDPDHHETGAA